MARGTCWEGYEQKGFKKKGSKSVPNCVKVGTMKGDMIKKPVKAYTGRAVRQPTETDTEFEIRHEYHTPFKGPQKAFLGLAVQAAKKSPMSLIGVGADKILKNSETARSFSSNLGIGGKMLSNYYSDIDDKKTEQKATGQVVAKAYVGKFIDVELDGKKYSNASKKNYYKGML